MDDARDVVHIWLDESGNGRVGGTEWTQDGLFMGKLLGVDGVHPCAGRNSISLHVAATVW